MEGIKTVKAKVAAYIHPSRAADVPQGVHEILNSLLLRYNEEFEGVLLAYLAPRLVGRTAKILSGLAPYFHVNLTAKLLLFSPAPGMKIEGKVNKIEKDYIGVLVLGLFNTTIGVVDIRDEFDYSTAHHGGRAWISNLHNRHTIELGSLIRFSVKRCLKSSCCISRMKTAPHCTLSDIAKAHCECINLQETEHIIDICGTLVEDDTGCVDWLEQRSFRTRSKGSKELKLRSNEAIEPKLKKSKNRSEHVQELKKRPRELEESHVNPMNEAAKGVIEEPLILPKRKKKKVMDVDQSIERSHEDKSQEIRWI